MKTSSEDISSVKKKLTIEIESKTVDQKVNEAYRELGKKAKIPGFRPGKVPKKILERRFGNDVAEDVTKDLINESLPKAITELDVMPLGAPLLEKDVLEPGRDFKYTAVMEVRPEFELKDYLGVDVEKEKNSVTEKDVLDRIEQIRQGNGNLTSIEEDRAIQKEDHAVLDYEAFEDERPVDDMKATNFPLKVGSNDFHPQFEEGLIGLKKGNEKEISVTFEDGYYNSKIAGKTLNFKVKAIDIKEMVLPELTNEFVKTLGADFKDLEDLKSKVHEMTMDQENNRIDNEMKQRLLKKISDSVDFEFPQILVESELNYALENFKQNIERRGASLEQAGITEEKLRADFRPASEIRVKEMLVLEQIAKTDNITVEDEDLAKGYEDMAASMGLEPDMVRQYYEAKGMNESLREKLIGEKTLNYLIDNAKVIEVERDALKDDNRSEKETN